MLVNDVTSGSGRQSGAEEGSALPSCRLRIGLEENTSSPKSLEQGVAGEIAEFDQFGPRHTARHRLTNRCNAGRHRKTGQPIVMMIQNHAPWPQQVGLPCHELGERALNGFAIDPTATSRTQDGHIRTQVVQDAAPWPPSTLTKLPTF